MLETLRLLLVTGALLVGTLTNGVQQVQTSVNNEECTKVGENRWSCDGQECFYHNGEWICIDPE